MKCCQKFFYYLEAVLSLAPGTLLMIVACIFVPWLAFESLASSDLSGFMWESFLLWIGGMVGMYGLWSLFFKIEAGKRELKIAELPWISIICGMAANIYPVVRFLIEASQPSDVPIALALLSPCIAAIHWIWFLTRKPMQSGKCAIAWKKCRPL